MPDSARTTGNSLSNCFSNLFGYLPAPYIYGFVQGVTGGSQSVWGLFALECAGILSIIVLICLMIKQNKTNKVMMEELNLSPESHQSRKSTNSNEG